MTEEELENKARVNSLVYNTKYSEDGVLEEMLSRPQDFVDGAIMEIVQLLRKKANRDGFIAGAKEIQEEIEQLKAQIEKMKCCENCKYHETFEGEEFCNSSNGVCKRYSKIFKEDNWEVEKGSLYNMELENERI